MKNILLINLLFIQFSFGQNPWIPTSNFLDKNNVRATINSAGVLFLDTNSICGFEVPKGSGKSTIANANLWIGGFDAGNQLKIAAQMGNSQNGMDFFAGPLPVPDDSATWNSLDESRWNRVWKINKTTIDSFLLGLYTQIPQAIIDWPGNGDTTLGQGLAMAPFTDLNGDGYYDPYNGDYPKIRGDQALYFIYNDKRDFHYITQSQAIGIEIHGMAYEITGMNAALENTVFINYQIINRSNTTLYQTYIGNWVDFDLGYFTDDFIGTDVMRNSIYAYNADADDDSLLGGYGINPPVQSLVFLNGPVADINDNIDNNQNGYIDEANEDITLYTSMYYNDDTSLAANPTIANEYYDNLKGYWRDGTQLEYGGNGWAGSGTTNGIKSRYVYVNDSDPNGYGTAGVPTTIWTEYTASNAPGDRRMLGGAGPFTLMPGEVENMDVAYIYSRGNNGVQSMAQAGYDIDSVQSFFNNNFRNRSDLTLSVKTIPQKEKENIGIYPNPCNSVLNILSSGLKINVIAVFDITGKQIITVNYNNNAASNFKIDTTGLASGLYVLKVYSDKGSFTSKFVIE